ncbi:uncharacterized protein CANTADRAFT_24339 [Suhomyces tanzawaensis NRRL Y-17324]|uniref:Uncharacterized protein n=1 Tax=Suhomyces tanzawaensis NRRL Y-17324 TaxID=984487 RepID=A0A1E4SPF2_9ASCO|nr:uncharacterized protein CANTADRAFT_24339 [Suhomyces tanzawaensis NRRL Y-17324]ODV81366.1 hypothetical protein CANTADRAFT_24339 [Suhomyces tanzawaensis NRRL Y-17324]
MKNGFSGDAKFSYIFKKNSHRGRLSNSLHARKVIDRIHKLAPYNLEGTGSPVHDIASQ